MGIIPDESECREADHIANNRLNNTSDCSLNPLLMADCQRLQPLLLNFEIEVQQLPLQAAVLRYVIDQF